jgi:hypothetical protein
MRKRFSRSSSVLDLRVLYLGVVVCLSGVPFAVILQRGFAALRLLGGVQSWVLWALWPEG